MRPRALASLLVVFATLAAPVRDAEARRHADVHWTKVEVPEGDNATRLQSKITALLKDAARKADFGKAKRVDASLKVTELTWQRKGDVLRLTCSMVVRIDHGPRAISKISFGGDPSKPEELEQQVLSSVTLGAVSRLAQLARTREAH